MKREGEGEGSVGWSDEWSHESVCMAVWQSMDVWMYVCMYAGLLCM